MKQCFGYIRVSTVKQGEGVSLEAQRAAIEQFVARNDITISRWFEEKQTAAKRGRPVFTAMLKELRARRAAGVVMHKIDRSARNLADWARIGELADAGIDVHFATESLDFRSRGGRLTADIQAVIAADYIRNLREETLKGLNGRLAQGIYPFKAPVGYRDNGGGKLKTPDPTMAPLVREAFELYASCQHTVRSLAVEMARRGLRNSVGRPLTKSGINDLLANPFYCGLMRSKRRGTIYKGAHEPIVSASLFERVQEARAGRYAKKITRHHHTYRGLFRCATCGYAIIAEAHKGFVYYRCQTPSCPTTSMREETLEGAISGVLNGMAMTDEQLEAITDAARQWFATDAAADTGKALRLRLDQIAARLDALTDALVDRLIDDDTYAARKERLLIERVEAEQQITAAQGSGDHPQLLRKFLERVNTLTDMLRFGDATDKREIVQLAILNRSLTGKNPCFEPSNWLRDTRTATAVLNGALSRDNARTRARKSTLEEHLQKLIDLAESKEGQRILALELGGTGRIASDGEGSNLAA
jgi:site-specific DNA recombinase